MTPAYIICDKCAEIAGLSSGTRLDRGTCDVCWEYVLSPRVFALSMDAYVKVLHAYTYARRADTATRITGADV